MMLIIITLFVINELLLILIGFLALVFIASLKIMIFIEKTWNKIKASLRT